jgi:predicted phosphodiesterase
MKFTLLSDVHGDLALCKLICSQNPDRTVLQIGDLGIGNADSTRGLYDDESAIITTAWLAPRAVAQLPSNFRFFVGNHDNRKEASKLPNCLGDFGDYNGLFFVSGADSYDKDVRVEGESWWPDEQLTYKQGMDALDAWKKSSSKILVAHDAPQHIVQKVLHVYDPTRTRQLLQMMVEARKPRLVVSGHHHRSFETTNKGTIFRGLGIGEELAIDT